MENSVIGYKHIFLQLFVFAPTASFIVVSVQKKTADKISQFSL